MPNDELLTDDYVANLLAADAKQSNIKYSALGLEAFNPSKPPANKPKPNTRFLRNIIKETDSHNAALLAKEAAESKARLQELAAKGNREDRPKPAGGDIRRRQLGDIAAILGGSPKKRKRVEEEQKPEKSRRVTSAGEDESERHRGERSKRHRNRDLEKEESKSSRGHRSHHHRRERSTSKEREKDRNRRRKERSRSRSPGREKGEKDRYRQRSPEDSNKEKSNRHHRRRRSTPELWSSSRRKEAENSSRKKLPEPEPEEDSDPLADIIGPRPPVPAVRSRGRGTTSGASGMDSRFSTGYDPTVDVQLDADEENDWEQALEALRDRQKWKQQGADRLRAAGFTDDEIKKWENGGEKKEEDVKWAKKGEGREWDRGKVINEEGNVSFESKFGRLNDT